MSYPSSGAPHLPGLGALALIAAVACCPKPPQSSTPEAPAPASAEAAAPTTTAPAPPGTGAAPADATGGVEPAVQTLFVRERRVDCQGEGARKCLQVRESESDEWRNFYAPIEGFEHEESHAYELRVEVTSIPDPPADGSSLRYRLLEVISKRKVAD